MTALKRVCLATSVLVGLASATGSLAQTASPSGPPTASTPPTSTVDQVVVTGSSIRGIKPVGSDVIGLSQADIQAQGQSQLVDVLRDVPQVVNLGADDSRTSPNAAQRAVANFSGDSSINLRGIGVEATLTLMDGQRLPSQGSEGRYFDPNSLPILAVQRVEIVPDGASAIYGSDAVAGVVNIIPVTKFDGVELQERYGAADALNQTEIDALAGHSWNGGHLVVGYEYNRRSELEAADRPNQYINSPLYGATSNSSFPTNLVNNPGPPPFSFMGPGPFQFVDVSGTGDLNATNRAATAASKAGVQGNFLGVDALPRQSRNAGYLYVDQNINDRIKVYAQGFATERNFFRHDTAQGETNLTIPGLASGPHANAYNDIPASVASDYSFLGSFGPEIQKGYEKSGQFRLGSRVGLFSDWVGNVYASAADTVTHSQTSNEVNSQALGAAASCVNPAQPNGPFAFPAGPSGACNSTATAFDPFSNLQRGTPGFGYPSAATYQSVLNGFEGYNYLTAELKQAELNFKVDGSLFDLPGGRVRFAVGADFQFLNRTTSDGGNLSGPSVDELNIVRYPGINRTVDSAYGELYIPIIEAANALPGVRSLSLSVAGRYDRYSDRANTVPNLQGFQQTFDTVNPKVGVNWKPIDDLLIRGSYGTSFRAPVLGDYSYGAPTLGIPFLVTPSVASALGLSASCATSPYSCYKIQIQGGDPNLKPETADTYSIGADYKPSWLKGFEASITYYNIDYKNQIVVPGDGNWESDPNYAVTLKNAGLLTPNPAQGVLGTYNNTVDGYLSYANANAVNPAQRYAAYVGLPGYLFANGISKTSLLVNTLSNNTGELKTDGLDYTLQYTWNSRFGRIAVGDVGTLVLSDRQSLVNGAPLVNYLNQIDNLIRFRTRGQVGWSNDTWMVNTFVNYVNAYTNPGVGRVGSYTTVDVSLAYTPTFSFAPWVKNLRFAVEVQNLFDQSPPYTVDVANQTAYDSQEASVIGRFVEVTLSQKF